MTINTELANRLELSIEDAIKAERLHTVRDNLHNAIYLAIHADNRELTYMLAQSLPVIELALQKIWGFKESLGYYKFWQVKGCQCPKMDNDDAYPTGYYTTSHDCWLHTAV